MHMTLHKYTTCKSDNVHQFHNCFALFIQSGINMHLLLTAKLRWIQPGDEYILHVHCTACVESRVLTTQFAQVILLQWLHIHIASTSFKNTQVTHYYCNQ